MNSRVMSHELRITSPLEGEVGPRSGPVRGVSSRPPIDPRREFSAVAPKPYAAT